MLLLQHSRAGGAGRRWTFGKYRDRARSGKAWWVGSSSRTARPPRRASRWARRALVPTSKSQDTITFVLDACSFEHVSGPALRRAARLRVRVGVFV